VFAVKTRLVQVSPTNPDPTILSEAAEVLQRGGLVAFPTETVYGLGADAMNPAAVEKIFLSKGRPSDNPLIVHVANHETVRLFARSIPPIGLKLAENFWPGPMTLVLRSSVQVPMIVRANLPSVAIRIPNHPVALGILNAFGGGVVAPSANLSGRPSPTTAQHVLDDLDGRVELVLDAGQTRIGVESTVIDVTSQPPTILRHGGLTREAIESLIGVVGSPADVELLRRSPGTRYRHYAPHAKVVLFQRGNLDQLLLEIDGLKSGESFAAIISSSQIATTVGRAQFVLHVSEPEEFARDLFKVFRLIDARGIRYVFVEEFEEEGIGVAIMDRLRKASAV